MVTPQLLAPAGGFAAAEAAFACGADAVYLGVDQFNLRAHSPSFTLDELAELICFSHDCNKNVYVALNTMPDDPTLERIGEMLNRMGALKIIPHAFIVSDPGVVEACRTCMPDVPLHLSTQTGTFNTGSALFWKKQGIHRVVLPREMTLDQITAITRNGGCETEVFVHGAMCVSIAGRCLIGAYMDGRHANQGDCSQPCRLQYTIAPQAPNGTMLESAFDVEEIEGTAHLLNSKDLNTIGILDRIVATGVRALKIEGRNKSIHYVSSVVKTYRAALDRVMENPAVYVADPRWITELELLDHRPYTTGFYGGERTIQAVFGVKDDLKVRVVGLVKEIMTPDLAVIDVRNPFTSEEPLNVLPVKRGAHSYTLIAGDITDMNGAVQSRAVTNRLVRIASAGTLRAGDILRRML